MKAKVLNDYCEHKTGDVVEVVKSRGDPGYDFVGDPSKGSYFLKTELEILPDDAAPTEAPAVAEGTAIPVVGAAEFREAIQKAKNGEAIAVNPSPMRTFDTGATRTNDTGKLDYEGFLSPLVLERYAQYLNKHRVQADGNIRDSDNWQKGIPKSAYIKSAWRHFMDWWKGHRTPVLQAAIGGTNEQFEDAMMAVLFNVMGYAHEYLKEQAKQ